MFAGISNYIWGTSNNEEPTDARNDATVHSSSNTTSVRSSNRNANKKSSKSVTKSKPLESTVSSDSGDESDSWVLVEEPGKAGATAKGGPGRNTSNSLAPSSNCRGKQQSVLTNASGKSSSNATGRNGTSKTLSRRSTTRVLVSSNSQVPVKVAPVRKPLRRHRQVSEQSLEDFPSLANDEKSLGSASKGDPNQSTTYAQVLATANSTSHDETSSSSSRISICKQVDLVAVDTALNEASSSSSPLPLTSLVDKFKGKPLALVIDSQEKQQQQQQELLVKKKGTGSPKSKKSRRHEATDEEWFMTPPPCFTRPNTFDMVKSPIEDMLIEQPIPSTTTPSTPSSIELDTCSLSSRESSLEDRGRTNNSSPSDLTNEEKNLNKNKQKKQQQEEEGGATCSLEETPTPIAFTDLQGEVEGKEKENVSSLLKRDSKYKSKVTVNSKDEMVALSDKCKPVTLSKSSSPVSSAEVSTASAEATSTSSSLCIIPGGVARADNKHLAVTSSADREGRKQKEDETEGEEEENNENWQSPVVKARQRLNSKGRLALDTYTVVSRKERRKKKKISSKSSSNNNNGNSNNDGNSGSGEGKHAANDWSRPSWSDASVINGAPDGVGSSAAASFAPSLKYMLKAVNRANQQKMQWATNCPDMGTCKSGPVRRKDKFAARPHSFCLNRKTNRNF